MNFLIPELIRAISYAVIIPSFVILCNRSWRARRYDMAILAGALALNYTWYSLDLTLVVSGQSTRELRTFATPLTVFVAVTAAALVFQPAIFQKIADRRRRQREEKERGNTPAPPLYFV